MCASPQVRYLNQPPPSCRWWPCHPALHGLGPKTSACTKNISCAGTSCGGEASTSAESWRKRCLSLCLQTWSVNRCPKEMFSCVLGDFKGINLLLFVFLMRCVKVRERREKTRLRVARWRAKRKLQACLNQAQVSDDCSF